MQPPVTRLARHDDVEGILALQRQNLVTNLSEAQKSDGFVTTPLTQAQLAELIEGEYAFVLAGAQDAVMGYVITGSWEFLSQWEIFNHMVRLMPQLTYRGQPVRADNSFQYGPVCIDRELRGRNHLPAMFAAMRDH